MTKAIKVGDQISDNDPRMAPRVLRVVGLTHRFQGLYVLCQPLRTAYKTPIRVRADRIYTDGKPRKSGFTLLKGEGMRPETSAE
jgi:hypothetical protein